MFIIGITGTLGAGKGTVVSYLVEEKGFTHFSVRGYLAEELNRRGMPVNRDTLTAIGNSLRAKHGSSFITSELFKKAKEKQNNCVIESIRTPGEIEELRKNSGFFLLAVDADPRVRYKRIRSRNSETDQVSFQTFMQNEEREMHSNDLNKQNLARCIKQADYVINNNGNINGLHQNIEKFLKTVGFNTRK